MREEKRKVGVEEELYVANQWQLMWRKFKRHKLAILGVILLLFFYAVALFSEFIAPYDIYRRRSQYLFCPPQRIHFFDCEGKFHFRPFVYGIKAKLDMVILESIYVEDKTKKYPIHFLARGDPYKLWEILPSNVHLFGVKEPGAILLFGTDKMGRDLFSRTLHASRTSLSIGLVGVALSFILGCLLGGISGYYGGVPDLVIQRVVEFLISIPAIPLWMGLAAALPPHWSPIKIYFGITIILSIIGWCGLARVVRGKLLQLREEDFTIAAKIVGATNWRIITKHLFPSFSSYLIVSLSLAIPYMILGETSLSFLGLGLRPPVVSWGVLLHNAQNVRSVGMHPWLLIPSIFVIIVVLAFNFLGEGLRDAADPYK